MRETIAFIIPNIFLFIYLVMASIEYGTAVFLLFPKLLNNTETLIKSYINPIWESSNVFLVFYIVSIFTFFPKAIPSIGADLLPILLTAMVLFIIKNACVLKIFFAEKPGKWVNLIFLVSGFASLIVLSWAYVYMITGSNHIINGGAVSAFAWAVDIVLILAAALLGNTFFRYFSRQINENHLLESAIHVVFALFILALFMLGVSAQKYAPAFLHTSSGGLSVLNMTPIGAVVLLAIILCLVIFYVALGKGKWLTLFLTSIALCAIVFFSLITLQLPFVAYPGVTIYNSFIDYNIFTAMIFSFVIGMALVIPSLVLLFRLFVFKKPQ